MVVRPLSRDEIWSSKMTNAVRILAKNVFVFAGLFAAVVTEDVLGWGVVVIAITTPVSQSALLK